MAKKKRSFRRSHKIPIAPVIGLVCGLADPIQKVMDGNYVEAIDRLAYNYIGVANLSTGSPTLALKGMENGLVPLIIGGLVHKYIGGRPLNMNRFFKDIPMIQL